MKQTIYIKAITEQGEKSLRQHLSEKKKESWKNRQLFKQICEEKVFSEEPFVLSWELKHRYFTKAAVLPIIQDAMMQNGAVLNKDYVIEDE